MKQKVLIVDDEQEIVDFLERFLRRLGLIVIKTTKSREVIELYEKHQPYCVFLDIQMPEIDGLEILRELKKTFPQARVIMVTGKEDKSYQDKARKFGALDYVTKPLDLSELTKKVQDYIIADHPVLS